MNVHHSLPAFLPLSLSSILLSAVFFLFFFFLWVSLFYAICSGGGEKKKSSWCAIKIPGNVFSSEQSFYLWAVFALATTIIAAKHKVNPWWSQLICFSGDKNTTLLFYVFLWRSNELLIFPLLGVSTTPSEFQSAVLPLNIFGWSLFFPCCFPFFPPLLQTSLLCPSYYLSVAAQTIKLSSRTVQYILAHFASTWVSFLLNLHSRLSIFPLPLPFSPLKSFHLPFTSIPSLPLLCLSPLLIWCIHWAASRSVRSAVAFGCLLHN